MASKTSRAEMSFGALASRNQGQRTLSPLCDKDLHQEVVAPACDLALAFDAVCRGMAFEQADCEAAKPGEIVGHVPVACTALVFVEGHVEHPMQ